MIYDFKHRSKVIKDLAEGKKVKKYKVDEIVLYFSSKVLVPHDNTSSLIKISVTLYNT